MERNIEELLVINPIEIIILTYSPEIFIESHSLYKRGVFTIEPIFFILLGAGAYVGWNIGANDTANCIGTTVGCGLLSFKKAVLLVAVFVILGAMLQGHHVGFNQDDFYLRS